MSSSIIAESRDCTERCRSVLHGDAITAAITKRSISDADLCSYLNYICTSCEQVRDSVGRTGLHVASSCGRVDLVRWLVQNRHANINAKDEESGYTALHRSIFSGKIDVAVELMKLGANIQTQDSDFLSYLEHAMKDGCRPEAGCGGELYVWGSNTNNSLGPQKAKNVPDLMDVFHKEYPHESVQQVCVDQFHSVIVTSSGKVFSCGHGQGGRLGVGTEQAVISPKVVVFPENQKGDVITCTQAAISKDHSLFLCSDGNVYSCGINTHRTLGITPPPEQLLTPRPVKHLSIELKGVCAAKFHSVAWGTQGLYTWGLNGGQLGHSINDKEGGKYILTPKLVKAINLSHTSIKCVAVSDGATALCTDRGDIYVLHEYLCRKITSRMLNVTQISIIGGNLNHQEKDISNKSRAELKVAVLTNTGNLLLWQETDQQLCRCIFSINRDIAIKQVCINHNELLFVTGDGEAFSGVPRPRKNKKAQIEKDKGRETIAFHQFLDNEGCIFVKLTKLLRIHRAIAIQSDPKGRDYCAIQAYPYKPFEYPDIEESQMKSDLKTLLEETDKDDNVHDIIFKVGDKLFPAHSLIIATKSPHLAKLIEEGKETIILNGVNPDIFEQFLEYVYTGDCELIRLGELKNIQLKKLCERQHGSNIVENNEIEEVDSNIAAYEYYKNNKNHKKIKNQEMSSGKNPVRLLQEIAKKYGVSDLHSILTNLDIHKYTVRSKSAKQARAKPLQFNREHFSHLYDVTVKCRDGKELRAHKCILAARMEYFNSMFSMRWQGDETTEVTLPFPKSVAESLLDYLYTDSLANLENKDTDYLLKVLILADQLFVNRLKEQCEFLLTNLLNLKNAVQLLSFAHIYNATKLKTYCLKFIVANITSFLELGLLEELEDCVLKELSEFYAREKPELQCRIITPYSTAVSDQEILRLAQMFPVDFNEEVEREKVKTAPKRRPRIHKSVSEKNTSISNENDINEKNTSISNENDVNIDAIIQFPDTAESVKQPEKGSVVLNRLQAVNWAREKVKDEGVIQNYTKLASNHTPSSSFKDETDFPELSSPPNSNFHHKTPLKESSKYKIIKMSQKQRKRLSSESSNIISSPIAESPKNPWKIVPEVTSPGTSVEDKCSIGTIISDEKKQKENFVKMTTKLLKFTQIEDKAIDELYKFYSCDTIEDEIITIKRVSIGAIASPVWVPRTK